MASVGQSIENPVDGERITWVETAGSTSGDLLAFDLRLRPGAARQARGYPAVNVEIVFNRSTD